MSLARPRQFDLVAFDWDGTLFDSTQIIVRCIQRAVEDVGGARPSDKDAAYIIGMYVLGYQRWVIDWALWPGFTDSVFGVGTEPYRWVSSAFLHFGLLHIGMNMLVLWQFGTQLEPALGRLRRQT